MTRQQKINYLYENHSSEWISTRMDEFNQLDHECNIFCICGAIASGFHIMSGCKKFSAEVDKRTIKRLEHLLPKK